MSSQTEILRTETLTEDGGVIKEVLQEGSGDFPNQGDELVGKYFIIPFFNLLCIHVSFSRNFFPSHHCPRVVFVH